MFYCEEDHIPTLHETDGIPFEKKVIYQKWDLKKVNFYWLIAELDKDKNIAFGYANLNNDNFAEWGCIDLKELVDNNAEPDKSWKTCTFEQAQIIIRKQKKMRQKLKQKTAS